MASCLSTAMALQMSQHMSDVPQELSILTAGPFLYLRSYLADLQLGHRHWHGRVHVPTLCPQPTNPLPAAPSTFPHHHHHSPAATQLEQAHSRMSGSEAAPQDSWLQLSHTCLLHRHHLAPIPSFPSSPRGFYGCG